MFKNWLLDQEIYNYVLAVSLHENEILRQLREETEQLQESAMLIPPEEGQFIAFLIQLIGAKKTLEIGVFTGYSTLWTALALPPDGRAIACDRNAQWTAIAQRYWKQAGVNHKIDLRLGEALQTLDNLLENSQAETFDFIFIDADKENDLEYFEKALQLARPGGLIAIDNALWSGLVVDSTVQDPETRAIRTLNQKLYSDERIQLSLLPIADGLTLARKKE
ncbi:class I SAM-dependent methyltransferase [Oscillatoria salina]|uniref:class I SAM-dependent methyltransferase n=1 Tax=Oscillatoria salina TaxID=331517 RepID=UPI0013BB154C|nr:class I SAM-dependent methyltransferase [Oscillatoria salina]MBZ8179538.1 SAM-dependent methyltransferase [Oscillatoria salina IIICB1]NET89776.1 SAM-dependent methyltransferase [Kamptonema sp. SIO1D9]